jgi:hypothetical protein
MDPNLLWKWLLEELHDLREDPEVAMSVQWQSGTSTTSQRGYVTATLPRR